MSAALTRHPRAHIREAETRAVTVLFDIRERVNENQMSRSELYALGFTEDVIREQLKVRLGAWVAEVEGQVVGYSMADRERGCVWAMFVLPEFQGQGLGAALLGRASEHLFTSGLSRVFVGTDPASRAYGFYIRQGFTDAGPQGSGRRPELARRTRADASAAISAACPTRPLV